MPKIAHIIPSLKFGGAEKFLIDIYPFLNKKWDHIVCPFIHTGELYTDKITLEKSKNHRFWTFFFKPHTWLLLPCYCYRAVNILRKEKPDIVVSYTTISLFTIGIISYFKPKKKFKWYARLGGQLCLTDLPPFLRYSSIFKILSSFYQFLLRILLKNTEGIIVISDRLKEELVTLSHINPDKIHKISDCTTPPSFLNNTLSNMTQHFHENHIPYFVSAGRLEEMKGFDFLITAFADFVKVHPHIKLVIFGNGSRRPFLEKQIKKLNLEDTIFLPGFIESPARTFSNAIACIIPSRLEPFGKIIIEAMQHAAIVIASNSYGPQEIIENGVDGILFEKENKQLLLQAMNHIINLPDDKKEALKKKAYQKSLLYAPECISQKLNALIDHAIE